MAYENLKTAIKQAIKQNGNQEITGSTMQSTLLSMVDNIPEVVKEFGAAVVVMAFDEGTGLTEHAAPGEAIIFALDGEGIISYEGKDHVIKAGENFCFAKGGMHAVKASKRFKMALLLTLEQ